MGDGRHRVPHPRRQGLPLAGHRLLRRHAAELVDLHVPRRRDGQLVAAGGVRVARRGRPSRDSQRQGRPLPMAWVDKDMRGEWAGQVHVKKGLQPRQRQVRGLLRQAEDRVLLRVQLVRDRNRGVRQDARRIPEMVS